jgi:Fur family transcriptional regulator, peroxide stress response regulator
MTEIEIRFNQLIGALKERDFRLTPQRLELVRLIAASEGHPSASQLFAQVKEQFPTMSHATVYKTLNLLKEMGQVFEIDLRGDSHYDGNRPEPHPHLVCLKCSKIMDGEISLDQNALRQLEHDSGYSILRSQITLYGLCADCRENEKIET